MLTKALKYNIPLEEMDTCQYQFRRIHEFLNSPTYF